jgi:Glycosyltransferase
MRKLKIGILVESFPRISQTWLDNQLIDLKQRGNEIRIFSVYPSPDPIIHQAVIKNQLLDHAQYFFNPKTSFLNRIAKGLAFSISSIRNVTLPKLLKGTISILKGDVKPLFGLNYIFLRGLNDLDILHAHFGEMGVFAAKMRKAGLLGKAKLVVSFHGHDIFPYKREFYRQEYQIFKDFADGLIVNSLYSKNLLDKIIRFQKVRLIPVGLSSEYFKPEKKSNQKLRIVFLGRLVYLKGGSIMIEIFRRLSENNDGLELLIIGDGEGRAVIEKLIMKYDLGEAVFLKGALSQDQILNEFNSCSIYVYPGLKDPFFKAGDTQGLVVQEAQAMELPVVCSDVGGVKYGMVDEVTGYLVKEGDIEGFVKKIQFLIDHPEIRFKMGKAGRSFVKEKFDSKVIGNQLVEVYHGVLQSN